MIQLLDKIHHKDSKNFFLIAGPCAIEGEEMAFEIAEKIVNISGKKITIFYDTSKPEGDKARSADYSKAKFILGWEPKITLEEGLREQYVWIKQQIENEK